MEYDEAKCDDPAAQALTVTVIEAPNTEMFVDMKI